MKKKLSLYSLILTYRCSPITHQVGELWTIRWIYWESELNSWEPLPVLLIGQEMLQWEEEPDNLLLVTKLRSLHWKTGRQNKCAIKDILKKQIRSTAIIRLTYGPGSTRGATRSGTMSWFWICSSFVSKLFRVLTCRRSRRYPKASLSGMLPNCWEYEYRSDPDRQGWWIELMIPGEYHDSNDGKIFMVLLCGTRSIPTTDYFRQSGHQ